MFLSLKHRSFRLYTTGVFVVQTGFEMQNIALTWYLYRLTGSAMSLGFIGLARIIPIFLFALIAGHVSDTKSRRKVLFYGQLVVLMVAALMGILSLLHLITPLVIYASIFISSTALTFTSPASQAFMPALVPKADYMNAVNINSIGYRAALVMGPALAGFIIAAWGVTTAIFINAVLLLYFIIIIYKIGSFPQQLLPATNRLNSIKEGIAFVKSNPLIWSAMFLDFIATFFASGMTLMPVFAQDILKVGPQGLGILYAAPSVGGLVGGFLFSTQKKVRKQGEILIIAVIIYGFMTVLFGLSTNYLFSIVCMALVGAADMVSSVIRSTIRQMVTPDHLRGRMVSINMIFYLGGPQLGEVESGLMASVIGTPYTVVFGGIATVLATVFFAVRIPELMHYESGT